jgi:hypothetical protein
MSRLLSGWKYALLVVVMAVAALMIIEFNGRMAEWRRLSVQQGHTAATATSLAGTYVYLQTQVAHATSGASVEEWSYTEGRWVQSNEILVVPLPDSASTPAPTPTPLVTPRVISNWQLWLSLFLDRPTPAP